MSLFYRSDCLRFLQSIGDSIHTARGDETRQLPLVVGGVHWALVLTNIDSVIHNQFYKEIRRVSLETYLLTQSA